MPSQLIQMAFLFLNNYAFRLFRSDQVNEVEGLVRLLLVVGGEETRFSAAYPFPLPAVVM